MYEKTERETALNYIVSLSEQYFSQFEQKTKPIMEDDSYPSGELTPKKQKLYEHRIEFKRVIGECQELINESRRFTDVCRESINEEATFMINIREPHRILQQFSVGIAKLLGIRDVIDSLEKEVDDV